MNYAQHHHFSRKLTFKRGVAVFVLLWLSLLSPVSAFAQAVDATGNPTGAPADTGAPACTGAGCGQGADQGTGQGNSQGLGQGGPSLEDLGAVPSEDGTLVLPAGVQDTRQGASQGTSQGTTNGIAVENTATGAGSTNTAGVSASNATGTSVTNRANDATAAQLTGTTGGNAQNKNTQANGITSGNAGIGVTQVKNDNTAVIGGTAGLTTTGHIGNQVGDLNLGFGAGTANLSTADGTGTSVRAVNDTTGSDSTNAASVAARTEALTEVQNDGRITNLLNLMAITGQNEASMNTGGGVIHTGDADVAATLVNLLNTTVINGNLWVTVADVFGSLIGNIYLPQLAGLLPAAPSGLAVEAENTRTGENSQNTITVGVTDTETTKIANDADISTVVNARAITGQNEALRNTGGATVTTGDASVSASNITLANTVVEGGTWGLVIVNALNRWLGFLVGDAGQVRALSQEETIRQIGARNTGTGADSNNEIGVAVENDRTTDVNNVAVIDNQINAAAITGQNTANMNTGAAQIETGRASVSATAVNIANTTVKDGSLFIAVVNIFGDWFGDLFYSGNSLLAASPLRQGSAGQAGTVQIDGTNRNTGANSTNTIDVNIDQRHETAVDNQADISTILNADIDTGSNRANSNTLGGTIQTGHGQLSLHSRAAANLVALALEGGTSLQVSGLNDTTGTESTNRIRAHMNDERIIRVNNNANVSTVLPGVVNTGNNEASFNTLGAEIVTGDAAANIGVHNLVNRVLLALNGASHEAVGGSGVAIGDEALIDLINRLTGALSSNTNNVVYDRDLLVNLLNRGVVDNLINLLLNTGGNKTNNNTRGGSIASGEGCIDGSLTNDVNSGPGAIGGASLTLGNDARVKNVGWFGVTTGDNETNATTEGTAVAGHAEKGPCQERLVLAPTPSPSPSLQPPPGGVGGPDRAVEVGKSEEMKSEEVGEDEAEENENRPHVLASVDGKPPVMPTGRALLERFPVAGMEQLSFLLPAQRRFSPWLILAVGGMLLLSAAWHFDQKARLRLGFLLRQGYGGQIGGW